MPSLLPLKHMGYIQTGDNPATCFLLRIFLLRFFFNKSFHGWADIFSSHNPHPLDYLEKVQSTQLAQLKVETLEG